MARRLHDYLGKDAAQSVGFLTQSYLGWKQVIDGVVQSLQSMGRAQTAVDKIQKVYKDLQDQQQRLDMAQSFGRDTSKLEAAMQENRQLLAKYKLWRS